MHTPETRLKMRNSRLGKKHSEQTRKKISASHMGKRVSDEARKKMSIAKTGKQRGEQNPTAKLTEAQVLEIRSSRVTHKKLARQYGVTGGAVAAIRQGKNWKWLSDK